MRGRANNAPPHHILKKDELPFSTDYIQRLAKYYDGKYLLRSEIAINESVFQKLIRFRLFKYTQSIKKTSFLPPSCLRCNNQRPSLFANIPCTRCKEVHIYCRKCIHMGRIMECERLYYWSGPNYDWPRCLQPSSWKGNLTESQLDASSRIIETVKNGGELLIWAVTGSGKTEMLFPSIQFSLEQGKRICIATPRADVVRELLPRLQAAFSTIHIQGLYSGSRDNDGTAQLLIATTHQLLRYRKAFDVLIIDEIDAFPFHQDNSLPFAAKRAVKENASLVYLTATPRQKQQMLMFTKKLAYAFVPIRFHGNPLPVPTFTFCTNLHKQIQHGILPVKFIAWLKERQNPTRQLLLFVPTISLSRKLVEPIINLLKQQKLIKKNAEVESVSSTDNTREEKIEQFRKRKIYCLITTTILERGVTFPSVDVAVIQANHTVFDEQALVQIAGRAGRSLDDPIGEVVFFHGARTNALVYARQMIVMMNRRAEKYKTGQMVR